MIDESVLQKLRDAVVPGNVVTFDPDEAAAAGAFVEDALAEDDALASCADLVIVATP